MSIIEILSSQKYEVLPEYKINVHHLLNTCVHHLRNS
jgi:hypothetical protein